MILRTILFVGTILAVLGTACTYMVRRSVALWPWLQRHSWLAWSCMGAFLVLFFAIPLAHRLFRAHADVLSWLSYGLFSLVSSFLLYLLVADLFRAGAVRLGAPPVPAGHITLALAATLALISAGFGLKTALRPVEVQRIRVPISNLPPELHGFRIAQISDLHVGALTRPTQLEHILQSVRLLQPDLIAVTGDLVDGDVDGGRPKVESLKALQAPGGIFFVTGNHEYYAGVRPWLRVIQSLGWQILSNTHQTVIYRDATLVVAGLPDPAGSEAPDVFKALSGAPEGFRLLLNHRPDGIKEAAQAGVHLQLSGHTHGGQYAPWSWIIRAFHTYAQGLHRYKDTWIYTSRGTGFWGPPNRFMVPPELTLLELERSN